MKWLLTLSLNCILLTTAFAQRPPLFPYKKDSNLFPIHQKKQTMIGVGFTYIGLTAKAGYFLEKN